MAIIVDKAQKRRDIARSCKEIILQNGIQNLTISTIAKTEGIGKGTFYEYFKIKEALLFELVNILLQEYNIRMETKLSQVETTKEKVKVFSDFFYEEESHELRILYKMFTGVSLLSPQKEMVDFQRECFDHYYVWFERLIEEGIAKGEILPEVMKMTRGIFATAQGMYIVAQTTHCTTESLKQDIHAYIDTLFDLCTVSVKGER
jgi:AcrR family transcriptional regulator